MEKQASKIQKVNSYIDNRQYRDAFNIMYSGMLGYATLHKGYELVQSLMENRTNGNFLHACAILEDTIETDEDKIERQRKSTKVRAFVEQYKKWNSGYSMGEIVNVVYVGRITTEIDKIKDSKQVYRGNAKRWNNKIKYGEAILRVDLTGNRAKYSIEIIEK